MRGSHAAVPPAGLGAARRAPDVPDHPESTGAGWHDLAGQAALIAIVLLLVHDFVRWSPYTPVWDDSSYFGRAACVDRAAWALNAGEMKDCWASIFRSPVMAMLALPWGPAASTLKGLGLCMVSLGVLNWALALATLAVLRRLGVGWPLLLLATIAIRFNPVAANATDGGFFVDLPFAWIATLAVLLIPLELRFPAAGLAASARRGMLWGVIASLGVLAKVSFGYFVIAVFPLVFWLRWRSGGRTGAVTAAGAAMVVSLPALAIWIWRGAAFMQHASSSAWGDKARFFSNGQHDVISRLWHLLALTGAGGWCMAGLALLGFAMAWHRRARLLAWAPTLILLGYLAIALSSENADMRFALPAMIGLPFTLALLGAGTRPLEMPALLPSAVLCVLLTVPMAVSFDPARIEQARLTLTNLAAIGVTRATVATNSPKFTYETFLLARELGRPQLDNVKVDTVVLDYEAGLPLGASLAKLRQSQAVIFEMPLPTWPDYTNVNAGDFLAAAEANGTVLAEGFPDALKVVLTTPAR